MTTTMRRNSPTKAGTRDPETILANRARQAIFRALSQTTLSTRSSIASKIGKSFQGKRDIYKAFGYPGMNELTYDHYMAQYRRGDIAGRLIDAPVDGSWQLKPEVYEGEEENETAFEKDWQAFVKDKDLWRLLVRSDKLARIGRYGVLLFGLSDVRVKEDLRKPVSGSNLQCLFLQPYGESSAEIVKWDENPASPRYGMPLEYRLTNHDPGQVSSTRQLDVHFSRILHIAEGCMESNVFGTPALERVYNRLINLELIVGGSAEMFWQGAFPGYAFTADADTDMSQTATALEAEIDLFVHDFKRYMNLQGITVEKLSPEVANPSNHVNIQLQMVSVATGIPKRILEGSERGELSSGQDESHWNDKLKSRQEDHINPAILNPLIDRLIEYGVLAAPGEDGYTIDWPDLNAPKDKDKAEVGKIRSEAIKNFFASPSTEQLMTFGSFLEEILDLDSDTVQRIVEAAESDIGRIIEEETEGEELFEEPVAE